MRIGLDLDGELNHIHKLFQLEIRTLDTSLASWYLAVPTYTSYELLTTLSFIVKSAVGGATMWYKCQPQSKISPSHFLAPTGAQEMLMCVRSFVRSFVRSSVRPSKLV